MVNFSEDRKGYNKGQVDEYIKTINTEYEKLVEEYQALLDKVDEQEDTPYSEAIVSALVNAEITGKQVVAKANSEAERVVSEANLEAKRVVSEANKEVSDIAKKKNIAMGEVTKLFKALGNVLDNHSDKGDEDIIGRHLDESDEKDNGIETNCLHDNDKEDSDTYDKKVDGN